MNAVWIFREKIVMFSRSPHDLKFDLSRRSQDENGKKNVAKCKKHVQGVQSYCFFSLNMQIYGVLVAVAVGLEFTVLLMTTISLHLPTPCLLVSMH